MEAHLPALAAAALVVAALTLWRPLVPLIALFAALPFLTHHPSTAPAVWLMTLVAAFQAAWVVRGRRQVAALAGAVAREPLLTLGAAFAVAAVASLIALPLGGLRAEYSAAFGHADPRQWPRLIELALRHVEFRREFSVVSALLLVQAALLMVIVYRETAGAPARARAIVLAIVSGVALSITLGAAELVGLLSLEPLRGTAGVFYRPGTLQATAGNPGWFTQYVVYALPYGLVLAAGHPLRSRRGLGLAAFTAALLAALVFGFQRGGWVTGAVVAAYVVGAARALAGPAPAPADGRGPWLRAAVVTAVVLAVLAGIAVRWRPAAPNPEFDVAERVRSIVRGDRWPYWQAAGLIWTRHPVLGGGHESFAYRYREYFETPGGVFETSAVRVPDAASAHGLYMQTLAGTGAGGVVLLLLLFGAAAATWHAVRRAVVPVEVRAVAFAAGGSLLAVAVYGLVQEVFYVHALRLLTFAGAGLLAGAGTGLVAWPAGAARAVAAGVAALVMLHAGYERVWASPERLLGAGTVGLYAPESNAGHEAIRWTTEQAAVPVPAGATAFAIDVRSVAPFAQRLEVATCAGDRTIAIADHEWHTVTVPLGGCAAGTHVRLVVHPAWRPAGDGRLLGLMTRGATFR